MASPDLSNVDTLPLAVQALPAAISAGTWLIEGMMMNQTRTGMIEWLAACLLMSMVWVAQGADDPPEVTDDQIATLIEDVREGSPQDRVKATERLVQSKIRAVAPLADAAETEVREESARCFDVLGRLLVSDDEATSKAVQESLEKLSESAIRSVALRAKTTLRLKAVLQQREAAMKKVEAARKQMAPGLARNNQNVQIIGNKVHRRIEAKDGDEEITIKDIDGKEIQITHTRPVDGKSKTDEYKADTLEDLKKNHPDAAKLYEKHAGRNVINGGVVGVQIQIGGGAVQPIAVPIQAGIQIGNGGPLASPAAGPRTIRAEQDGLRIEIRDLEGSAIQMKLTRAVDGKDVTEEITATDVKDLLSKNLPAARLYEQFTGQKIE